MNVQPLPAALAQIRALLLDPVALRRAVAAGRRRNRTPSVVRVELRPVALKSGPRLQIVEHGDRPHTRNVAYGPAAEAAVDALLAEAYGSWHVQAAGETVQLRVTKRGDAQVHRSAAPDDTPNDTANGASGDTPAPAHDRAAAHLLDPGDPLFEVIGGTAAKRRQVDAFLRALSSTVDIQPGTTLSVADLGCGNAYLTFAAYRWLTAQGAGVEMVGVDRRADQRDRNTALAQRLGWAGRVRFVAGAIGEASLSGVDIALALHACDTATDDALARAVRYRVPVVLAAPCCHHDIAAQLKAAPPGPFTRYPILRERFADVLTDTLRAALLRQHGYRVDVVEFVESKHTPRNLLIRARYTGTPPTRERLAEYAGLVAAWPVAPALARLLAEPPQPQAVADDEEA